MSETPYHARHHDDTDEITQRRSVVGCLGCLTAATISFAAAIAWLIWRFL